MDKLYSADDHVDLRTVMFFFCVYCVVGEKLKLHFQCVLKTYLQGFFLIEPS
jgi:hypothetical protein